MTRNSSSNRPIFSPYQENWYRSAVPRRERNDGQASTFPESVGGKGSGGILTAPHRSSEEEEEEEGEEEEEEGP